MTKEELQAVIGAAIDERDALIDDAVRTAAAAHLDATEAREALADAVSERNTLRDRVQAQDSQITAKDQEIAALRDRLEEYETPDPDPDPDPEPPPVNHGPQGDKKIYLGGCILTTAVDAGKKWGPTDYALRQFYDEGDGFVKPSSRPPGVGLWHVSWKPPIGTNWTDDQLINMFSITKNTPFRDGDVVEPWHELAVKLRNGSLSATQVTKIVAQKVFFYNQIDRLRKAGSIVWVEVSFTDAAWTWDSPSLYPGTETDQRTAAYYGKNIKADLLGIDYDAYNSPNAYPNFIKVNQNVQAFYAKYATTMGVKGIIVPEIAHQRIAGDASGAARTAWITKTYDAFFASAVAPEAVIWFDRPWSGFDLVIQPSSPEMTALQAAKKKGLAVV